MAKLKPQEKLGKKVRELRLRAGYSQEKLGEVTGLDRTYISGIERGVRNPSLRNIERLSKALKVKVSQLMAEV
jgi:transcriptional regulator with XRE-family HTH domain